VNGYGKLKGPTIRTIIMQHNLDALILTQTRSDLNTLITGVELVIGDGRTTSGVAVVTNEHTRMKAGYEKDQFSTKLAQTVMTITDELPMILVGDLNGGQEKREARSIRGQISDKKMIVIQLDLLLRIPASVIRFT
jgi:hypothetical protein